MFFCGRKRIVHIVCIFALTDDTLKSSKIRYYGTSKSRTSTKVNTHIITIDLTRFKTTHVLFNLVSIYLFILLKKS